MLTIRLQRIGRKKFATYRLVVAEKARDTQGNSLEIVGTYNPHASENGFLPKTDRIKYWLDKGAVASDTVNNLLISNKVIEGKKKKSVYLSQKRQAKLAEKKKEAEAKAAEAKAQAEAARQAEAEAKAQAEAEAKAAEEKPAEEVNEAPVEESAAPAEENKEEPKAE